MSETLNWEALGAIGELIGAFAVVLTLGYLAVQVRQNTKAVRVQIRQAISDAQFQNINVRATDPRLPLIITKARKGDALTEEETTRLYYHLDASLRQFENIHSQHLEGMFPAREWEAIRNALARTLSIGAAAEIWTTQMRETYNEDFRRDVDEIVAAELLDVSHISRAQKAKDPLQATDPAES